jgi:hypothetical protein
MNNSLLTGFALGVTGTVIGLLVVSPAFSSLGLTASVASAIPGNSGSAVTRQIACGRLALQARERAILAANRTYTQAVSVAYTQRATALDKAYVGKSSWAEVTPEAGAAVSSFGSAVSQAQAALQRADDAAAANYSTAITACIANNPLTTTSVPATTPVQTTPSAVTPPTTVRQDSTSTVTRPVVTQPATTSVTRPGLPSTQPIPSRSTTER